MAYFNGIPDEALIAAENNFNHHNAEFDVRNQNNPERVRVRDYKKLEFIRHFMISSFLEREFRRRQTLQVSNFEANRVLPRHRDFAQGKNPDIICEGESIAVIDVSFTTEERRDARFQEKLNSYQHLAEPIQEQTGKRCFIVPYIVTLERCDTPVQFGAFLAPVFFNTLHTSVRAIIANYEQRMNHLRAMVVSPNMFRATLRSFNDNDGEIDFAFVRNIESTISNSFDYWVEKLGLPNNLMELVKTYDEQNSRRVSQAIEYSSRSPHLTSTSLDYKSVTESSMVETFKDVSAQLLMNEEINSVISIPFFIPNQSCELSEAAFSKLSDLMPELKFLFQPELLPKSEYESYLGRNYTEKSQLFSAARTLKEKHCPSAKENYFGIKKSEPLLKSMQSQSPDIEQNARKLFQSNQARHRKPPRHSVHPNDLNRAKFERLVDSMLRPTGVEFENLKSTINEYRSSNKDYVATTLAKSCKMLDNLLLTLNNPLWMLYLDTCANIVHELVTQDWPQLQGFKRFDINKASLLIEAPGPKVHQDKTTRPFIHIFQSYQQEYIDPMVFGRYKEYEVDGKYLYISSSRNLRPAQIESWTSAIPCILASAINYMQCVMTPTSDEFNTKISPSPHAVQEQLREYCAHTALIKLFASGAVSDFFTNARYVMCQMLSTHANTEEFILDKFVDSQCLMTSYMISSFISEAGTTFRRLKQLPERQVNKVMFLGNCSYPFLPRLKIYNSPMFTEFLYFQFFGTKRSNFRHVSFWKSIQTFRKMQEKYDSTSDKGVDWLRQELPMELLTGRVKDFNFNPHLMYAAVKTFLPTLQVPLPSVLSDFAKDCNDYMLSKDASNKRSLSLNLVKQYRFQSFIETVGKEDMSYNDFLIQYPLTLNSPIYVEEMLKPEWAADDREAFIGDYGSMTNLRIFETLFKHVAKASHIEMISKPGKEKAAILNRSVNEKLSEGSRLTFMNIDKTKWNFLWDMNKTISLLIPFQSVLPPSVFKLLMISAFRLTQKFVRVPINVSTQTLINLFNESVIDRLSREDLIRIDKGEMPLLGMLSVCRAGDIRDEAVDLHYLHKNLVQSKGETFLKVEMGFLAGFINYASSVAHSAVAHLVSVVLQKRGFSVKCNLRHSDDSYMAVEVKNEVDILEVNRIRRAFEEELSMKDSTKKVWISQIMGEFCSEYHFYLKYVRSFVKFTSNIDDSVPMAGYCSDIKAAVNFCASLFLDGMADDVCTAVMILFQFSVQSFYNRDRFQTLQTIDSLRAARAMKLKPESQRVTLKPSQNLKTTVEMVLGDQIKRTSLPPQLFGLYPMTAGSCAILGISSWYAYIYHTSDPNSLAHHVLNALLTESAWVSEDPDEEYDDLYSPGTFPLPIVNLRFENNIVSIRRWTDRFKTTLVDEVIKNPALQLFKSSNPELSRAQVIARVYSPSFKNSMSLDGISRVARALRSSNHNTVMCFDEDYFKNAMTDYLSTSLDEKLISIYNSTEKELLQHYNHPTGISKVFSCPYKVYVYTVLMKSQLSYTLQQPLREDLKTRCSMLNPEKATSFEALLSEVNTLFSVNDSTFIKRATTQSAVISPHVPYSMILSRMFCTESQKDLFFEDIRHLKNSCDALEEIVGQALVNSEEPKKSRTTKGFSITECIKIVKELTSKSSLVTTRRADPEPAHDLVFNNPSKGIYHTVAELKTVDTRDFSAFVGTKDYSVFEMCALGNALSRAQRFLSLDVFLRITRAIQVNRIPPTFSVSNLTRRNAYDLTIFYHVMLPTADKNYYLNIFCREFLSFAANIETPQLWNNKDSRWEGDIVESYEVRGDYFKFSGHWSWIESKFSNFTVQCSSNFSNKNLQTALGWFKTRTGYQFVRKGNQLSLVHKGIVFSTKLSRFARKEILPINISEEGMVVDTEFAETSVFRKMEYATFSTFEQFIPSNCELDSFYRIHINGVIIAHPDSFKSQFSATLEKTLPEDLLELSCSLGTRALSLRDTDDDVILHLDPLTHYEYASAHLRDSLQEILKFEFGPPIENIAPKVLLKREMREHFKKELARAPWSSAVKFCSALPIGVLVAYRTHLEEKLIKFEREGLPVGILHVLDSYINQEINLRYSGEVKRSVLPRSNPNAIYEHIVSHPWSFVVGTPGIPELMRNNIDEPVVRGVSSQEARPPVEIFPEDLDTDDMFETAVGEAEVVTEVPRTAEIFFGDDDMDDIIMPSSPIESWADGI